MDILKSLIEKADKERRIAQEKRDKAYEAKDFKLAEVYDRDVSNYFNEINNLIAKLPSCKPIDDLTKISFFDRLNLLFLFLF